MKNDIFANIAAGGIGGRSELLEQPKPKEINFRGIELSETDAAPISVPKKMDTIAELTDALKAERAKFAPYLADHSPEIQEFHEKIDIKNFTLYREDGKTEKITIPHYGAPLGSAELLYDSQFSLTPEQTNGNHAVYICVGGADYIAHVYINGVCVGVHEGFFSPFEFEITQYVNRGLNTLRIELKNDYVFMGSQGEDGKSHEGEKMYAATGIGWDDAGTGWHHCPPGMGLYKNVYVDVRPTVHISDLFVRPLCESDEAELWVEVQSSTYGQRDISFELSVYGQNFEETVIEKLAYNPSTVKTVGLGDTFSAAINPEQYGAGIPMPAMHGKNIYKIRVPMKNFRRWDLDSPYLYSAQVTLFENGKPMDAAKSQFGMRTFTENMDEDENGLRGMFFLNGRSIRLRGANTMGFEQNDVLRGDTEQLIDDILLAKLCNMNFLRLTQRPVQDEVYTWCDRLGLMTQTDLPLFAKMRRTKFAEGVKQAEEMERLIRSHACNVVVSYMNEPSPNAGNEPHRHLIRTEMEEFFKACDIVVHLTNPDRVIKHIDGDYDPPCESLPDNHCYTMWYNGHGIDFGMLHRGYWMNVKPGFYYGCGEYGVEGLDFENVMREDYPAEWITSPFDPGKIVDAQTANFYYFFYDEQDSMSGWISESQKFQAFGVRAMTEAFRRDNRMITNAIHLFIDAWPSGWMKTIMDCRRQPKPAYFAYRNALEPVMLSLRTDRFTYYCGEQIAIEAHICNDTHKCGTGKLIFELYKDGELVKRGETAAEISENRAEYAASAVFTAPQTSDRQKYTLRGILTDSDGKVTAWNEQPLEVFAHVNIPDSGETVLIEKLTESTEIAGELVRVKACGMSPVHFASRKTGHPAVAEFEPEDIRYFYDAEEDMITPIVTHTFEADGFTPILVGGNTDDEGNWHKVMIAGEKEWNGKKYVVCNVDLRTENPIAERLRAALLR